MRHRTALAQLREGVMRTVKVFGKAGVEILRSLLHDCAA
jgi:hypothetical protein